MILTNYILYNFKWNDLVELFRNGMVCKKHWHRFKVIQNCFTANEAVDWLLNLLQSHKTFGKHVSYLKFLPSVYYVEILLNNSKEITKTLTSNN